MGSLSVNPLGVCRGSAFLVALNTLSRCIRIYSWVGPPPITFASHLPADRSCLALRRLSLPPRRLWLIPGTACASSNTTSGMSLCRRDAGRRQQRPRISVFVKNAPMGGICLGPQKSPPVSFTNDVVPILHEGGLQRGRMPRQGRQRPERISAFAYGFEPGEDFEHVVNEARGRRISQTAPERSLLLLKATGAIPHGGGVRLQESSDAYRTVRDWVRQGPAATRFRSGARVAQGRSERASLSRHERRQLRVTATYADGRTRDVTQQAVYESNDRAMAEVDEHGGRHHLRHRRQRRGHGRYQAQIAVLSVSVPHAKSLDAVLPARELRR